MSTGTRIVDRRFSVPGLQGRTCSGFPDYYSTFTGQGYYYSKTWDGGDSSSLPYNPPQAKEVYVSYGTPSADRQEWIRVTHRLRPPKRKKVLGENPYTATIFERYYYPMRSTSACPQPSPFSATLGYESNEAWAPTNHRTWDANDDIALIGKLRERIQGSDFNAAVSLAEGKQAVDTVAEAAQRIRRAASFLRGGNVKKAARSLLVKPTKTMRNIPRKEVTREWFADNWLQLQYGWRPLIGDVFSAVKHLAHLLNRRVDKTYRARRFSVGVPRGSDIQIFGGESRVEGRYKAVISHINEVSLVGLTDPASLLWEKLPYSFVADWFIPVGNYLEAAGLSRSLTGTFVKTIFRMYHATSYSYRYTKSTPYTILDPTVGFEKKIVIQRTVSSSLIVPLPRFKPLSEAASWQHAVNAVALIIKAFPRFG